MLIELVWLSTGTRRAETVVTIEFIPEGDGTRLRLSQAGFPDEESMTDHEQAWPVVLDKLYVSFRCD